MLGFECIDAYYKINAILANSEDYFWRRFLANRRDKKWADGVKFLQRFRHVGFFFRYLTQATFGLHQEIGVFNLRATK